MHGPIRRACASTSGDRLCHAGQLAALQISNGVGKVHADGVDKVTCGAGTVSEATVRVDARRCRSITAKMQTVRLADAQASAKYRAEWQHWQAGRRAGILVSKRRRCAVELQERGEGVLGLELPCAKQATASQGHTTGATKACPNQPRRRWETEG